MNGEFSLSFSKRTALELRRLLDVLRDRGKLESATRALRWIAEELSRTPMEFGESRYDLQHLDLHLRVACIGEIRVDFAVHLRSHQVFIRRWSLMKP
jgi:hypothetical protein